MNFRLTLLSRTPMAMIMIATRQHLSAYQRYRYWLDPVGHHIYQAAQVGNA